MSSASNHSKGKDSTRSSQRDNQKGEGPSSVNSEDGSFCSDASDALETGQEGREGEVVSLRRVNKMPSGLSSTCSFASLSGDELGSKISEEGEMNDDDESVARATETPNTESAEGKAEIAAGLSEMPKTQPSDMSAQKASGDEESESTPKHRKAKKSRFKRQKNAPKAGKEDNSKCVIQ